jgi:hypothetical protein
MDLQIAVVLHLMVLSYFCNIPLAKIQVARFNKLYQGDKIKENEICGVRERYGIHTRFCLET